MLCALTFVFLTRKVKHKYFSAKKSIYLFVSAMVTGMMICIVFFVRPSSGFQFFFLFILLNATVIVCFVFLFLPPLLPVIKTKQEDRYERKQIHHFKVSLSKINNGTFKTVQRSNTYQYWQFRTRLFALPQTTMPIDQNNECSLDNGNNNRIGRKLGFGRRKSKTSLAKPSACVLEIDKADNGNDNETKANGTVKQSEKCVVSQQDKLEISKVSLSGEGEVGEEDKKGEGVGNCNMLRACPRDKRIREIKGGSSSISKNDGDISVSIEQEGREERRREESRDIEQDLVFHTLAFSDPTSPPMTGEGKKDLWK